MSLTKVTTRGLDAMWKKEKGMENYSAHSIKRGRDFSYNGINVNQRSSRRDCVGKAAEAFIEERSVLSSHDKIWRKPSGHGSRAKNERNNEFVVRKHTICRMPKWSSLTVTAQEKESPLHVTKIEPMSISFIKGGMSYGTVRNNCVFFFFLKLQLYILI